MGKMIWYGYMGLLY